MTDLRTMDNLTLILEYGRAYGNELPGEYKKSLEIELLRRLSPTAQPPEGVGYDRSNVSPRPWILRIEPAMDNKGRADIMSAKRMNIPLNRDDQNHIVCCVNSHDRLTSLVQRLAELAREFIDDEVGCTARQYNEVNNSPCSTCPNRKLCQIIAEAGVPDAPERCEDNPLMQRLGEALRDAKQHYCTGCIRDDLNVCDSKCASIDAFEALIAEAGVPDETEGEKNES